MAAKDKPSPQELALLEPFRGKVPADVFGEPFTLPEADGSGHDRKLLRQASALLKDAGYEVQNGKRVNAKGEGISIEFLSFEPAFERHHAGFIRNLSVLGIDARLRLVDGVQYRARVDDFDFDITTERFGFSSTPGESLRSYFSAQAARTKGLAKSRGNFRSGRRRLDRKRDRGEYARGPHLRLPRARPRAARRPLLGSALEQGHVLACLLGRIRLSVRTAALCAGDSRYVVGEAGVMALRCSCVMAGLVPAIHALHAGTQKDVDARHKAGHDDGEIAHVLRLTPSSNESTFRT
jgi:hypothetical protein